MFRLARHAAGAPASTGNVLPIAAAADDRGAVDVAAITDDNPRTGWFRSEPQYAGQTLQLDLGRPSAVSAVVMALGGGGELYPRWLNIATSLDGRTWDGHFAGRTGGRAFLGVLDNPRNALLEFPLASPSTRFVRLRLERPDEKYAWIVTDVVVRAAARP
jgi:hypothetical protein